MQQFRDTAFRAAREAGKVILKHFNQDLKYESKDRGDILSRADLEAEKKITEILEESFPNHSIFSEESKMNNKKSEYLWVIDPLDGTSNFMLGIPYFGVSLALLKGSRTMLGVIYDPIQNNMYHASKGAFVDGRKLEVRPKQRKPVVSLIVGYTGIDRQYENITPLMKNSYRVITNWSPALDFCLLALNKIDAIVALQNEMEDTIAGMFIAREAGAVIKDFESRDYFPQAFSEVNQDFITATDKRTADYLLDLLPQ